MNRRYLFMALLAVLLISSFFVIKSVMAKTPQQPYQEIGSKGPLEFRYYPESFMATVTNSDTTYRGSSNKNFRVLAGYIFGNNLSKEKIAMTAPVHMGWENGQSSMSFVMPEGYDLSKLPTPATSAVQLHKSPEEYVVVIRFGGYASDEKIEKKKDELKSLLKASGIPHQNNFRFLGYNAPWDFLFRRNEIVVSISKEEAMKLKK